jgi:hypothetical protein
MQDYQTTPYPSVNAQNQSPQTEQDFGHGTKNVASNNHGYGLAGDEKMGVAGNALRNLYNQSNNYYGSGYINPNDKEYASKTYAQIIEQEYADYKKRFQPYEERLMSLADSRELLDQQLGRISTNINKSFDNPQYNAGALQQERYGISRSAQSSTQGNRQNDMNRALSMAHAKNNTRVADGDRRFDMVTGADSQRANVMRQSQGG